MTRPSRTRHAACRPRTSRNRFPAANLLLPAGQPASAACRSRTCWARTGCWPNRPSPRPAAAGDLNGGLHHRAKVKRVVQLFMNGGASPMDTFDYKPRLAELNGQTFDPGGDVKLESVTGSPGFKVLKARSSSSSMASAAVG